MIFCARATRGLPSTQARDPEPVEGQKTLVGRAQWKINQPPSLIEVTSELGGSIIEVCSFDAHNEEAPSVIGEKRRNGQKPFLFAGRAR